LKRQKVQFGESKMKKFAAILISLSALGISALAQTNRATRPRIVAAPSSTKTDSPAQNNPSRLPVLKGDTATVNQTTPTANNPENAVVEDDEVIRVETDLVTIPVSVIDRDGRFISGLKKEDFKIFENGVEQQIDSFTTTEQPFTVVLLLDVSPSTQYKIEEIQNAAITFVNQLRRDDKVIVISFDQRVHVLSRATSDRNVLRNAIQQASFGDGTSLYEAVDNAVRNQLWLIEGRKAVVLFTDGVDTTSRRSGYQTTLQQIQETDILFYPIRYDTYQGGGNYPQNSPYPSQRRQSGGSILGNILGAIITGGNVQIGGNSGGGAAGSSRTEYETGRRYLEELAHGSGGRMFEANRTNNLDAAFSGIAEELRRQYSLGYYPENAGQKGDRKQIRVRVSRPNLAVRSKTSYVVGDTSGKIAGKVGK
jgi:Ca-activated chloride channel homolog